MAKAEPVKQKPVTTAKKPVVSATRIYYIIVFAFSFLLYANTLPNDYNLDDELVTQNHRLTSKGISAIPEIFTSPYYEDENGYSYEYRPIVLTTFAIEHSIFGENPHVGHFINTLLYALLCVLLLKVLSTVFSRYNFWLSFIAVLLFVAYPMHTEVVSSIKNRDEILAFCFGLGSFFYAHQYAQQNKPWMPLVAGVLFTLGLLSKSTIVPFVVLIPLLLITFTNISYVRTMLVFVLILLPIFLTGKLLFLNQYIFISAGITLLLTAYYFVYRKTNVIAVIKELYQKVVPISNDDEQAIQPAFNFKSLLIALAILVPFAVFFYVCINHSLFWPLLVTISILLVLYLILPQALSQYALLPLLSAVFSMALLTRLRYDNALFFIPAIALLGIYGKNKQRNTIFLFAALASVIALFIYVGDGGFLFIVACYVLYKEFNKKWIVFTGIGAYIVTAYFSGVNDPLSFIPIGSFAFPFVFLLSIIFCVVIFYPKIIKGFTLLSVLLICVATFVHTKDARKYGISNFTAEKNAIESLKYTKAPNPIKTNPNRPLQFMEAPVTVLDPLPIRLGTSLVVLGHYLKMLIVPYPMGFYYGYSFIKPSTLFQPMPMLALLAYLVLLSTAVLLLRKHTILSFSIFWFLVSIAVFSGLIQPVPGMLADRYLFIPSLGLCLALSYLFFVLSKVDLHSTTFELNRFKAPVKYIATSILLLYSITTFGRNFSWKDRLTLFNNDIEYLDKSAQAHNLLAIHLARGAQNAPNQMQGTQMMQNATLHFKKALDIYPQFFNAAYDLGRSYSLTGQYDSAIAAYRHVLEINDTFTDAAMSIGILLDQQGNPNEAISYYRKVINERPTRTEAYTNISFIYFKQKNFEQAIQVNKEAIKANPKAFEPYANIGKTYVNTNNMDSAFVWFERAYEVNPTEPNLVNTLYKISLAQNNQEKAKFYYTKLNELGGPPSN